MRRLFLATLIGLLWTAIFGLSLFAQFRPEETPSSPSSTIPPFEPPAGTTITVTTGLDNLTDNGDCTLREAIQAANTDAAVDGCPAGNGDDLILLAAASYRLSLEGRSEDENATGDLDIRSSLVISGAGSAETTIDANQTDRVLHILTGTVEIRGVAVQNGRAADGADGGCGAYGYYGCTGESGGGIANHGSIRLIEMVIQNNRSGDGGYGHGIGFWGGGSGGGGGGTYNEGNLEMFMSSVSSNSTGDGGREANGGDGGGILNTAVLVVNDTTFTNNKTGDGGAVAKWYMPSGRGGGIANQGILTMANSQVLNNSAGDSWFYSGWGGGIYNIGTARLTTCTIAHNAGGNGYGGAGVYNSGEIFMDRCSIYMNMAFTNSPGGGLHNMGTASLINTTVSSNTSGAGYSSYINVSGADGGGVYNQGNLLLQNTTIAYNQTRGIYCGPFVCNPGLGGSGGGLANDGGAVTIHNSLIAQNGVADGGSGPDCVGVVTSQGPNFIGDPTGCTLGGANDDILNFPAFLGPLSDNGGPTPTHALLPYSLALDVASCTDIGGAPILTDQRGELRPQGAGCDLGAFESALSTIPLPEVLHLPILRKQP